MLLNHDNKELLTHSLALYYNMFGAKLNLTVVLHKRNFNQFSRSYQQFSLAFDIPARACTSPGPETTKHTAGLHKRLQNFKYL